MYPENEYLLAVGKAYYTFAYYEWIIAYTIDYLGKVADPTSCFFHGEPKLLGGPLANELRKRIEANLADPLRARALAVQAEYDHLRKRRNALVHAHPLTDAEAKQRLGHSQERHWSLEKLTAFTAQVRGAMHTAGAVSDEIKALAPPLQ